MKIDWQMLQQQDKLNLVKPLADGNRSGAEIAILLGVSHSGLSKNVIIAFCRRFGLPLSQRHSKSKAPNNPRQYVSAREFTPPEDENPTLLIEAGSDQCRRPLWGEGSDEPRLVCGAPTKPTRTYCETCKSLLYKQE